MLFCRSQVVTAYPGFFPDGDFALKFTCGRHLSSYCAKTIEPARIPH
jgi:hypothetical protein